MCCLTTVGAGYDLTFFFPDGTARRTVFVPLRFFDSHRRHGPGSRSLVGSPLGVTTMRRGMSSPIKEVFVVSTEFSSLNSATLRSMAKDIGFTEPDLTFLGNIVARSSQRATVISFGVTDSSHEPALYSTSLLPSGEIEVIIDVPSLAALGAGVACEHSDVSLLALYASLLENAPYETLQEGRAIYTPLGPKFVSLRDAFFRKHQWRIMRSET